MGGPHQVVARMHPIPYVPPHGLRNAATDIHGSQVTACSIVTISGINLSTGSEAVGNRPPRILLAGTSVHMGDNYLPLYAVTPGQITAQLPCGLSEGQNTLAVRSGNEPEVTTDFIVVRSAPGLFATRIAGQDYAVAVHADGSAVTQDSPAVYGETVTVYGTGFGPLLTPAPEGMVTPVAPEFQLADPVQVLLGGTLMDPAYAGAAGLGAGMDGVRIQIGTLVQNVTLKVTINGQDSNSVMLPIGQ
jgi:uncharacterized protein (TIGR03437 family)